MALSNLDMDGNTGVIKLYESEGFIKESVLIENTKQNRDFVHKEFMQSCRINIAITKLDIIGMT